MCCLGYVLSGVCYSMGYVTVGVISSLGNVTVWVVSQPGVIDSLGYINYGIRLVLVDSSLG